METVYPLVAVIVAVVLFLVSATTVVAKDRDDKSPLCWGLLILSMIAGTLWPLVLVLCAIFTAYKVGENI